MNTNLDLWDKVEKTDPSRTKGFSRSGGFKGTAINATYLAKKATEVFGPIGIGWGFDIVDETLMQGAPILNADGAVLCHEIIHKVRIKLWYAFEDYKGEVTQFGQTQFVGRNKNGPFTDEEAPKKSLTDAFTKCLSLIGFSADVHLGLFDDNKYVNSLVDEFDCKERAKQIFEPLVSQGSRAVISAFKALSKEEQTALREYATPYKERAIKLEAANSEQTNVVQINSAKGD